MEDSRSTDTSHATTGTSLSVAGKSKKMDDTSSVDTAELLRSILQNKQPSVSVESSSLIDVSSIGNVKQPCYRKTHACENVSDNLPADEGSFEFDSTASTGSKLHKISSSLNRSSMNASSKMLNLDDGDSVETSESVRRIRQPLECYPITNANSYGMVGATNRANNSIGSQSQCKHVSLAMNGDVTICTDIGLTNDMVTFPNFIEINVPVATDTRFDLHLAEQCDDEFILPDQAFSSDDESSLDENKHETHNKQVTYGTSTEQRCANDHTNYKSIKCLREDGTVKFSSGLTRNVPNVSGPNPKRNYTKAAATSMSMQQSLDCQVLTQSVESASFMNMPIPSDSNGFDRAFISHTHGDLNQSAQLKTNENLFDCNQHNLVLANESNINTFKHSSRSRNEIDNYPKRYHSAMDEENIDNFSSDDEYVQASGFGEVNKVLLEQRQRLNRFDHFASRDDTKSLAQKYACTAFDPIVPGCHLSIFTGTTHNINPGSLTSCTNGKTCFNLDSIHCTDSITLSFKNCKSITEQNFQAINRKFSSDHSKENKNQPRRIRDPSSRPNSVVQQSSNLTSAKQLGVRTNHVTSINNVPDLVAGSTATTTWERNDVFGGSGVGAGSYQMHRRSCPETQTMAEDIFSSEVSSNPDKVVLATKRRPASKTKTFTVKKKNVNYENKVEGKRAYRGRSRSGGKRGKWGWKNKAKQTTKEKRNTSSQQGQRRVTNTWVGNTDDPQLRHVGGAEMSF